MLFHPLIVGQQSIGRNRVDVAIADLNLDKEKVTLSIKLLEEIQNKMAIDKFGNKYSGMNLPFSQLSDKIFKTKRQKKEK